MLLNQGYQFNGKPTHRAYFVVTSVCHDDRHMARYSIKTLGIKNGNPTGLTGWTSGTHKTAKLVKKPPPRIVEEAAPFIGEVYKHLI